MSEKQEVYKVNKKLRCVGDRVIIKMKPTAYKEFSIDVNEKDKIPMEHRYQGIVVLVGDGRCSGISEELLAPDCKPGDIVYYSKNCGTPLMYDFGEGMMDYLVIRESNIDLIERK